MDHIPDCQDGCPQDPNKTTPGMRGCGFSEADSDGDGIPDYHDPVTPQGLAALTREVLAIAKSVTVRDRAGLTAQLQTLAGYLANARDNSAFTAKQNALLAAATDAVRRLAGANGSAVARRKPKAIRLMKKLLRVSE